MNSLINRNDAIDLIMSEPTDAHYPSWYAEILKKMPSAEPETYKEKLKEIADALSEKFAYMNTCQNERDIILSYLGVKHSDEIHCNTDCTNDKCESYHFNKKMPSTAPDKIAPKTLKEQINLECNFCRCHERGDTLYESSDWDGGICFDYIRDIKYCPICGRELLDE